MSQTTILRLSLVFLALASTPRPSPAASKEIQELQRDIAQLQDQLRQLQQGQDRQLTEIRTLVQQAISSATDASKSSAVIQSELQKSLRDQEAKVVAPVVGLSSRMDQVTTEVRTLQQAMADLTNMLSKVGAQIDDLKREVKVIQTPPAPPPSAPGGSGAAAPSASAPTISASDLYMNAMNDMRGNKLDLALQEFSDYLKWYGDTDRAPNAQYYIASIHLQLGEHEQAAQEFDLVLEHYSENNKTPDAMYGKAQAILKMGRRTDAAREFQELANRFPKNPLATQACSQVTNLGFRCTVPSSNTKAAQKKSKKG